MRTKCISRFTVKEFCNRATISYRVDGYLPDGTRIRENYPERLRALSRQAELEIESTGAQTEVLITRPVPSFVSQAELDEAVAALRLLKRKAGLLTCADFFLRPAPQSGDKPLSQACSEFLAEKQSSNLRPHTLRNLRDRLGRFVAAHPDKKVCGIQAADIRAANRLFPHRWTSSGRLAPPSPASLQLLEATNLRQITHKFCYRAKNGNPVQSEAVGAALPTRATRDLINGNHTALFNPAMAGAVCVISHKV